MKTLPAWLQRLRQNTAVASAPRKPGRVYASRGVAVVTLLSAVGAFLATIYYGERSERAAVEAQFTTAVEQALTALPKLRAAEERTTARITQIDSGFGVASITTATKECLNGLRINAVGELRGIQSITQTLNELVFNFPIGPPAGSTAADLMATIRSRDFVIGMLDKDYAAFNSQRIEECLALRRPQRSE